LVVLLFCAACGREEPSNTATTPPPPPIATTSSALPPAAPPRVANQSTPQKCAGDGSYEQALDCFHISSGFRFVITEKGARAEGMMLRPTPGAESVAFRTGDAVTWTAEATRAGVVWLRHGTHVQSPPAFNEHVWQRTTMVLDPQKKEGSPQLSGTDTIFGEPCNHYHFTNANSGEGNDVWVSTRDGRIVKWTAGKSTLELH
jgi:hypothetical protein